MRKLAKPKKKHRRGKLAALIGSGAFVAGLVPHEGQAAIAPGEQPPALREPNPAGAPRQLAIPSQPLIAALRQFSSLTGILTIYDPAQLTGLTAHAVSGCMTPEQALRAMLDGLPLSYTFVDARSVRITRVRVIANVEVHALQRSELDKLTAPLLRTPQTVITVPSAVIAQRNATSLADVMRNVSGISLTAGEGGAQGDAMTIRGFTSAGDIYLDGVRDFGEYYRDPFDLESVEVVEGPSSTIVGPGSAGGFINQVTKKPQLEPVSAYEETAESNDGERLTMDLGEPFGSDAAFRVDAMQESAGVADRNNTDVRRWGLAPSVEWGLGTSTRVLLAYEHLTEHDIPDYGIPYLWGAPAPVPRSNYYGFDDDMFDENANIETLTVEHDLSANTTLRNITRTAGYVREFRAGTAAFAALPAPGTPLDSIDVERQEHAENGNDAFLDNETDLIGTAQTGPFAHSYDLGVEYGEEFGHDVRPKYSGLPGTTLLDPDEDQPLAGTEILSSDAHVRANTMGIYGVDRIALGSRWELNGGMRYDIFEASDDESVTGTHATQGAHAATGHAGLVYDVAENGTIYLAYGSAFDPAVDDLVLTTAGSLVPPEFDESYELGSKWNLDDRLDFAAALFREHADNVALSEESYTSTAVLVGDESLGGVQLSADGKITDRLSLRASYTLLDGTILESDESDEASGDELVNTPHDSAALWSIYDAPGGWEAGLGAEGLTTRFARPAPSASSGNVIPQVPGYWRLDAMFEMPLTSTLGVQLNLNNLTDKEYYDAVYTDHVVPGAGLSANLSIVERLH